MATFIPNTTLDIYRANNGPPATPDVEAASGHLVPDWTGSRRAQSAVSTYDSDRWTHVLTVVYTIDIRDGYEYGNFSDAFDTIYVPDQDGTPFRVRFVERGRGPNGDIKRVYLDRGTPPWPSNEL